MTPGEAVVELLRPSREHLPEYVRAMRNGWSPDNAGGPETARKELAEIDENPDGFVERPPFTLGHIRYSVVPWKRRRGYATAALGLMLQRAKDEGLEFVEITTDPENVASQRVILANGGVLVERFLKPSQYGGKEGLRYRIHTGPGK